MSYEFIILVLLMMAFWAFMTVFTVKVMFSMFNSMRNDADVKLDFPKFKSKKQKDAEKKAREAQRKYEIIMDNLDAYDGTEVGQKEVR